MQTGQLLVAALAIPLLLLARRKPTLMRSIVPAVSVGANLVSGYWLLERLQPA